MALRNQSAFLYGLQVTELNSSLDFRAVALESPRMATLQLGYYSLGTLMIEVARALNAADPLRVYTVTADRSLAGGTQNRVTISSNGTYLDLLFASGARTATTCASLLGFSVSDRTGSTMYTGNTSTGTLLIPTMVGYNYKDPKQLQTVFGSVNLSASGKKETIVYAYQFFWEVEFKYEPETFVNTSWTPLNQWLIAQKTIDFTPDITSSNIVLTGTLESTEADGQGLGFMMNEMLDEFPFFYTTGVMRFRVNPS